MNTQLIPVFTGDIASTPTQLVDARLLHSFLESAREFATWIKNRIEEYGFIENQDYSTILSNRSGGTAGKKRTDYHITLDMAKELSMVERNEKGKQARRYFIECERHLINAATNPTEKPEALPGNQAHAQTETTQTDTPINATLLIEMRNGQVISTRNIPPGSLFYDPRDPVSVKALVMNYIPAQQLGSLLDATMSRMQAIAHGQPS